MIDERTRRALAEVEAQRDDALTYLATARGLLDVVARGHGVRASAQEIARLLMERLGVESCVVALREGPDAALWLAGFATQADRFGGTGSDVGETGWLALARLVGAAREPTCFRRTDDGDFAAIAIAELSGEGWIVLPFAVSDEPGGALVLHTLVEPSAEFGRAPALALLADLVGDAVTVARAREATGRLCDRLSEGLGSARRELVTREQSLRTLEESVEALAQELTRANKVKSEFLSTVSHELRTPLNAILGYTSLLRDGVVGPLTADQGRLLERTLGSSRHLSLLVDDVLFFVQLESDAVLVRPEAIDFRELVSEVLAAFPDRTERVPLELQIAADATVLGTDRALLRRILFHLLGNAFKFTSAGKVTVVATSGADTDDAVLTVRDTGIGVPADRQDDIFEAFAQVDGSDTRRFGGMGMGLALVRRATRLLGGDVTVRSRPGVGSEFRVHLPGALRAAQALRPAVDRRALH